jgi:hypothetical protein
MEAIELRAERRAAISSSNVRNRRFAPLLVAVESPHKGEEAPELGDGAGGWCCRWLSGLPLIKPS